MTIKMTIKKNILIPASFLLSTVVVAVSLCAAQTDPNSLSTFNGEIMDSLCAKAGTHDQMMKDMKSMGTDKATCSVKCIQLGAKYVLYDANNKAIYELDDQSKAEQFAGQRVRVEGAMQKKKIKVASIAAAQ
jgi:hypothetical protein